jgi:hypothetical protein
MGRSAAGRVFLLALVVLLALQTPTSAANKVTTTLPFFSPLLPPKSSCYYSWIRLLRCQALLEPISDLHISDSVLALLQPCVIFFQNFPANPYALFATITNE